MNEKHCLFCNHFTWSEERMWGMGSEYTGPMMEGGWAECAKKHFKNLERPEDEQDFRRIILMGEQCPDYDQVKGARK